MSSFSSQNGLNKVPILEADLSDLSKDVLRGLSASPKVLSSKFFYDKKGSKIFQEIMRMPEYYPTDVEFEIFNSHKQALLELFTQNGSTFRLVEFGAGDGLKTKILLEHFLRQKADFTYMPIDISGDALDNLQTDLEQSFPDLSVQPIENDYFQAMEAVNKLDDKPKALLFLGSNIGNFIEESAISFLQTIHSLLSPQDVLLIGFDLKKDPRVILSAYDDPSKITKAFNINLLERINRELGANFQTSAFDHYATYDPISGETKSYIISEKVQDVYVSTLDRTFHFEAWEPIWTELSQKYSLRMIEELAVAANFTVDAHFFDKKRYFTNSAWRIQ